MFKLFALIILVFSATIVSIYSLSVADINGGSIRFNQYINKKILVVNTATGNAQANQQLTELQHLYQQQHDSLVIIAFPSNSFGNEPGTNAEIKNFMQATYGITFPIAAKSWLTGDSANAIYKWFANKQQNDVMNAKTEKDFQKFLIDRNGNIIGRFDSSISPLSSIILNAVQQN